MTQFEHKLLSQARKTKGYLLKKSSNTFSSWKRKYFIFMQQSLSIFNDETLQCLQKSIMFQSIKEVNTCELFVIEIKLNKKVYYLKAQSAADQDLWIASVNILRENHVQILKSMSKKSLSSSQSLQKKSFQYQSQSSEKKSITSSMRSIENVGIVQKVVKTSQINAIKTNTEKQKITYLLRQKQLSKLLILLGLQKLSLVTKQQKYLKRILFIQDKKHGIYFSLSSKSIYPLIDSDLVREDFIYPYQLNVLYFLPMDTYKYALQNKIMYIKLQQVCKCSEILQCALIESMIIRLHIDCHKSVDIEVRQLSQSHVGKLVQCVRKVAQVGREYWNPKGKLMRNIDQFVVRYCQNQGNQLVFYKMVEGEFVSAAANNNNIYKGDDSAITTGKSYPNNNNNNNILINSSSLLKTKNITESHINKLQSLTSSLKIFSQSCQIKSPPLTELKQKYVRLYHKFVYNHLNQNWSVLYNNATDQQLIIYCKKVYTYYLVVSEVYNDQRVKQGCRTLVKIVLGRFFRAVQNLVGNFVSVEEQACRMLKVVVFDGGNNSNSNNNNSIGNSNIVISDNNKPALQQHNNIQSPSNTQQIFFSTFCTNLISLIISHFHSLTQLPKSQQLLKLSWTTMTKIVKHSLQKLSLLTESYRQRSSLISVTNSLRVMRNKRLGELFQQLEKTVMFSTSSAVCNKRQKQQFIKQINNEIMLVQTFCIKKLFVITFSSIDKQLLKHQLPSIDFNRICLIVIQEITKLQHILSDVRITMFECAFEQVCYFFYICVVKYDNSTKLQLTKDECLNMINMKMLAIRDSFVNKVEQEKMHSLLRDLNLLKQFITCPVNIIKSITAQLKRVFGSNFTQLNLKNLITLRASTLKQKQCLFEQCRQQIKTGSQSYNNSNQQMQSFYYNTNNNNRQLSSSSSFLNSSYKNNHNKHNNNNSINNNNHNSNTSQQHRRHRVSTLTESLKSYTQHFVDQFQSLPKKQRTILFGVQNSLYQGYMYRKKIIKNFTNTSYTRLFYRLNKGKLFEYDNQFCDDILNCYMLQRLKKCYPQAGRQQCFYLQFDNNNKQMIKFKLPSQDDATGWIMKILQAMQEQHQLVELNQLGFQEDGVLFQDLQKKITFQTKQTQQPNSQSRNYNMRMNKKKQMLSPDGKVSLLSPKKMVGNNNGQAVVISGVSGSSNNNNSKKVIGSGLPTKQQLSKLGNKNDKSKSKQKQINNSSCNNNNNNNNNNSRSLQTSKNKKNNNSNKYNVSRQKKRRGCGGGVGCNFF